MPDGLALLEVAVMDGEGSTTVNLLLCLGVTRDTGAFLAVAALAAGGGIATVADEANYIVLARLVRLTHELSERNDAGASVMRAGGLKREDVSVLGDDDTLQYLLSISGTIRLGTSEGVVCKKEEQRENVKY